MDQKQITAPDGGGRVEPRRDPPPRMPKNHLALAVLTTLFCCLPFGIVSIVYAVQVNSALAARNYELAKINSEKAKYWGMMSLWIGLAINAISIIGMALGGMAA